MWQAFKCTAFNLMTSEHVAHRRATLDILLRANRSGTNKQTRCQRVPCTLSHTNGQALCHIFHSASNEVEIPELPATLVLHAQQTEGYDTATLQCKHTFNPSALLLHFLLTDMRCPACREGPTAQMDVTSLPLALQSAFALKLQAVKERVEVEEQEQLLQDIITHTEIDLASMEAEFVFVMEMYIPTNSVLTSRILQTRIRPILTHSSGQFVHYVTQHAFQRAFNGMLRRHLHDPHVCVVFQIQHPWLQNALRTETFNLQQLHAITSREEFVASICLDSAIQPQIMGTLVFTPSRSQNQASAPASEQHHVEATQASNEASDANSRHHSNNANDQPPTLPSTQTHNYSATLLIHRDGLLALCLANLQQNIHYSISNALREAVQNRA